MFLGTLNPFSLCGTCQLDCMYVVNVSIDTSSKSASEPESAAVISQDILRMRLPPGTLHLGHLCVRFEDYGAHVAVDFKNQTSVKARLLIGADGVRSVVRRNLLSDGAPTYTGELLLCDRALSIFSNRQLSVVERVNYSHKSSFSVVHASGFETALGFRLL
jgi:2-polyprenyl-6-methoxyphenol hydroxylase-like FAD-dependent oxidoreductase